MDNVVQRIDAGNVGLPVISENNETIDLLNRQPIIDQLIHLLNIISDKHDSYTFALNGEWGVGKTFVLKRLMKQLIEYRAGEKFLVFYYNCWQYDYYTEPLVAIISAMIDSVEEETHLLSKEICDKARAGIERVKPIIETITKGVLKEKYGVDISSIFTAIKDGSEAVGEFKRNSAQQNEYDEYYAFKRAMNSVKKEFCELSKDRTLVVIVDELDRCLPEYAIKIMERLHHLFWGLSNTAIILGVDKKQLGETVQKIYGQADTTRFLKKFINFEVQLDVGTIKQGLFEKYADYFSMFDESLIETKFPCEEYLSALFSNIDIRSQERIMERVKIIHTILFSQTKKDYSFMCFELTWAVLRDKYDLSSTNPVRYNYSDRVFKMNDDIFPIFSKYINEWWHLVRTHCETIGFEDRTRIILCSPIDIPQLLIWYFWKMYDTNCNQFGYVVSLSDASKYRQNIADLKEVDKLLSIIK